MAVFFQIITYVIFPVFFIIAFGSLLHRLLKLEMHTISKMTTYFFMPTVAFVNMYESKISMELFYQVIGFLIMLFTLGAQVAYIKIRIK
jgi:predicted permease